jgi:RNase H-like domain found in reverse transcriptase
LMKEQRNYDTGDRELLAIVWALKEWRHYIQGSGHTTIVLSDHDNLRHFKVPQTIGQRMARWTLYLSKFDINCAARTFVCQSHQYGITEEDSEC